MNQSQDLRHPARPSMPTAPGVAASVDPAREEEAASPHRSASPTQPVYVGVEIGGSKLQVLAQTEAGRVVGRWSGLVRLKEGADGVRRQITDALEAMRRAPGFGKLSSIGVGFGGPVDWRTGRVSRSHQVEGWEHFELADWLSHQAGAPVAVDNDANVAALAESVQGAGKTADPLFYVTLGSGVGGGLVVGGRVYHGAAPGEAEFGQLRLTPDGQTVESRCSGWAIDQKIRRMAEAGDGGLLGSPESAVTQGGEATRLRPALEAGAPAARRIIDDLAGDLAFALSHVVHLFHPELIVVGGGLALVGDPLRRAIELALPAQVMPAFHPCPRIVLSPLGEAAVPLGGIELARRSSGAAGGATPQPT